MTNSRVEELFNDSYERIVNWELPASSQDNFFSSFYDRFIASSPAVKEAFRNTDMERQARMLRQSIVFLINFYATGNADDFLKRIADRHAKQDLDIRPELYDLWLESLLATVREYDPKCDDETEDAWRKVLTVGIDYMKAAYEPAG